MKVKLYRHFPGYYTDRKIDNGLFSYRVVKSCDDWWVEYPTTFFGLPFGRASNGGFKTLKEAKTFIKGL